jgi:WD40 repeat protein
MWPTDGHPSTMTGMLAHPGDIVGLCVSYDGNHMLTASSDGQVNQWAVNAAVLENSIAVANSEPDKWLRAVGQEINIDAVKRCVGMVGLPVLHSSVQVPHCSNQPCNAYIYWVYPVFV